MLARKAMSSQHTTWLAGEDRVPEHGDVNTGYAKQNYDIIVI